MNHEKSKQLRNELIQQLRIIRLAGIITESRYNLLLEDMSVVDRILDKISANGESSLTPEEKEYLDRFSKGEKDIPIPTSGVTKVYVSDPYKELFKIQNFPSVKPIDINFNCDDVEDINKCQSQPEIQKLLNNKNFKLILDKILAFDNSNVYFHGIHFDGNFSSPNKISYIYLSGDKMLYIVDSLDKFDDSKTEEDWGVKKWKEI